MPAGLVKQNEVIQNAPGVGGKYQLKDTKFGSSTGDAVDNTQSANPVDQVVSFQENLNMQGTASTFFYPTGKSAAQQY